MEEQEKSNLIRVLIATVDAIKKQDIMQLKNLSNETIHDAAIYQEEYSISIAVIIYALSKIYEREFNYKKDKGWNSYCIDCIKRLELAKEKLSLNDISGFDKIIKEYLDSLKKLDIKLRDNILEVIHKAKINKASRLYEHGISLGRTAELLGISRFELMDYIGKTGISDVQENQTIDPIKRLKTARGLFK